LLGACVKWSFRTLVSMHAWFADLWNKSFPCSALNHLSSIHWVLSEQ
jgi:hypothetical protein